MAPTRSDTKNKAALRVQAEKRLRQWGGSATPIPKEDVLELIHELDVHRVELEMQNEELRRNQSEIEGARKKYFELYDLAPVGYMTVDRGGYIREINLTAAEMLGAARRHLKGSRFARFVDSDLRDEFYRFCKRLFESRQREEVELELLPRGKAKMTALLSGVGFVEREGSPYSGQVAITDITSRIAAERWRQRLIDATQDAVIAIDSGGRILLFNGAAERIFGYEAAEIIGKKVNMLMTEPPRSEHDGYIANYERTGEKRAIGKIREFAARRKNGEIFPIELSVTEIGASDNPRYAAFIRDVSERERLQSAVVERARLATIGETAAQVAHEIANPLNGIAMGIELLNRQLPAATDAAARTTVDRIEREVTRLKHLLFDFRDLWREPKYDRRPLSLNAIVEELCAMQRPICESQGIKVEVAMEPELPLVFADAGRIKQVLLNICKNAEEAMPGGGTLTLRGYRSASNVILEVSDTGCGIAENADIFRAFKSDKAGGSGLGLVIARQIVTALGGTLTYTSAVGKGTSFILSLPALSTAPTGEGLD